jgi:hypothetical protein
LQLIETARIHGRVATRSSKGEFDMKIKSPKGFLALWSAFLAAGTWMVPAGALVATPSPVVAAPLSAVTSQPTGPGEWVWRPGANVAKALHDLSVAVSGQEAPQAAMLSIIEVGGEQHLGLISSDPEVDSTYWTSPLGQTATFVMPAESSSQLIEGEGGAVGVVTRSVTIQPVLLELSALPSAPALLGIQLTIDLSIQQSGAPTGESQFNAVVPLEFGHGFESEAGPLAALAAAIAGTTTDDNTPVAYPAGAVSIWNMDCTRYPDNAGWNGCYCKCWRQWKENRESFDDGLWIAIKSCKWIILATAAGCGAICLLSIPSGGGASVPCLWCLRTLGGEALACLLGTLGTYAGSAEHYFGKRKDCIDSCGNSNALWDFNEIEPVKISAD